MKNLVKMMMVLAALMVLGVGQVWAYPVQVDDYIQLKTTSTGGGYWIDYQNRIWYGGGDFGVVKSGSSEVLFTTFCLEMGVNMKFDTPYKVSSIENYVERLEGNRALKDTTKYLYWHFHKGTLAAEGYMYDQTGVRALQEAIWSLEGYSITLNPLAAGLFDLATENASEGAGYNVRVMNLMSGDTYVQSQLIAGPVPVPEPGTLLLLGSGLAGLALYRRRTRK